MKKLFYALAAILLVTACSPYQLVNSEVYNNADLAAYKTFRIVKPSEGQLPKLMTMVDYYNISNAIRTQMLLRGYVESFNASLMINIGLTVQTEIDTEPALPPWAPAYNGFYPSYIYPRSFYWQNYYQNASLITGIYKEGVLSMDMINVQQKLWVYSSSVSTILNTGQGMLRNMGDIEEAVQVLFSKFPVKPLVKQN